MRIQNCAIEFGECMCIHCLISAALQAVLLHVSDRNREVFGTELGEAVWFCYIKSENI